MLIDFEGIEGVGKTTQIRLWHKHLEEHGVTSVITREPGMIVQGPNGCEIDLRQLCFSSELSPEAAMLAFFLDRMVHQQAIVKRAQDKGWVVTSDRGFASTYAYQVGGQEGGSKHFYSLLEMLPVWPNAIIWLDVEPEVALTRATEAKGEAHPWTIDDLRFYERSRKRYEDLSIWPEFRVFRIKMDGTETPEEVHDWIVKTITYDDHLLRNLQQRGYR